MPTILVVEDEPAIRELIAIHLKHADFQVQLAERADIAETAVQQMLPDAVILDWMLPDGSGIALAKKFRANERTRNLPIIMLTARAHEDDKISGLEAGADDYITKPFSPKELVARIKALLRRRTPHLSGDSIEIGNLSINPATHTLSAGETAIELGPTEFRLLLFFMT
ncbi:MAG TPA: response regulator, partial [Pseudomonadales bacterium]|nr:response regulator [Pseudomonadales bacterium]